MSLVGALLDRQEGSSNENTHTHTWDRKEGVIPIHIYKRRVWSCLGDRKGWNARAYPPPAGRVQTCAGEEGWDIKDGRRAERLLRNTRWVG